MKWTGSILETLVEDYPRNYPFKVWLMFAQRRSKRRSHLEFTHMHRRHNARAYASTTKKEHKTNNAMDKDHKLFLTKRENVPHWSFRLNLAFLHISHLCNVIFKVYDQFKRYKKVFPRCLKTASLMQVFGTGPACTTCSASAGAAVSPPIFMIDWSNSLPKLHVGFVWFLLGLCDI